MNQRKDCENHENQMEGLQSRIMDPWVRDYDVPSVSCEQDRPPSVDFNQVTSSVPTVDMSACEEIQISRSNEQSDFDSNFIIPEHGDQSANNISTTTSNQSFLSSDTPTVVRRQIISRDNVSWTHVDTLSSLSEQKETVEVRQNLSSLLSIIYAVFLLTLGGVITVADQNNVRRYIAEIFSIIVATVGFFWLLVVHIDLKNYKSNAVRNIYRRKEIMQDEMDSRSQTTVTICNSATVLKNSTDKPSYLFLRGRHCGSFYLKIGMAAFCFGHLIYEGLQLGQQVIYLTHHGTDCVDVAAIVLHITIPIYSFYQLFFCFKYANVIINRVKPFSRFGVMHLLGTSLYFWLSTIFEDIIQNYLVTVSDETTATSNATDLEHFGTLNTECLKTYFVLSPYSLQAVPYLYPFTIEYNLLLAGVWFIVWQNVGKDHRQAEACHHTQKVNIEQKDDIKFESNLVLSVDCHSANRGLFAGLFLLFVTIVTVIIFFVSINNDKYIQTGVDLYIAQEICLVILGLICLSLAYPLVAKLDINLHPITFLDDLLMFLPLPFFFINGILTVWAESQDTNYVRVVLNVLLNVQVIFQTVFVSIGLRRCSNSYDLRYQKPGRELITFLIILNLAMWIVNTFQHKSVEPYQAPEHHYGTQWIFVSHITFPLMLFYRFHSSVCLADVWQSAYKKGE
ncbi:proton channel OtopLc-like isoform X2 [Tachypleus tridentatus]|uniref:proton channel OtopLc-like isoform X2 n=1 Tax=Tachypleus tridentatus TaxID=6853 RepID=UPI003FD54B8B